MANPYKTNYSPIVTDLSHDAIVKKGIAFTSPSVKSFQAYSQPLVLKKGDGPYLRISIRRI